MGDDNLRLYRGIAVPAASVADTTAAMLRAGLVEGQVTWTIEQLWRLPPRFSVEEVDLSTVDTQEAHWRSAVCACGTVEGATYYAWHHNRHGPDDTPILIEFEAHLDQVRIDGRDFLYTAFQMGDPEKARSVLEKVYGPKILRYADQAWASHDQDKRIALCHLATLDTDVALAHYANRTVIKGRYGTTFENAFTVAYPVHPKAIVRVWTPCERGTQRTHSVTVQDIVSAQPSQEPESRQEKEVVPTVSVFDIWKFKYKD